MNTGMTPENMSGDNNEEHRTSRRALRERLVAQRQSLLPEQHAQLSQAIREHLHRGFPGIASQRVAFCWPISNEPDLRPLMIDWMAAGKPGFMALLPVVADACGPLVFRRWTPGCRMKQDRYGIPAPAEGNFELPEVLLIPVNAFDEAGYRLGYGGGFFDRTLAALRPAPLAIGIGFELARVGTIFPQAHDMRLDAVVTEAGLFNAPCSVPEN